jgi:protein-S-isoprenylcysteine O-methyltransferase Ste14
MTEPDAPQTHAAPPSAPEAGFSSMPDIMVRQGHFLFRWRSYAPLLLLFPALIALEQSTFVQQKFGDQAEDIIGYICYAVSMAGLLLRWFTIGHAPPGTSGRNTKAQRADVLNTTGMYSIVRNPLYLGNFIALAGILLSFKTWWLVLLGGLAYWIFIERIIAAEEGFLAGKFGDAYLGWARRTPLFIPDLRLWRSPETLFSWKRVLRSEYNGLIVVGAAFFLCDFTTDIIIERETLKSWAADDWFWIFEIAVSVTAFAVLRFLKKKTSLLGKGPPPAPLTGNNS